jgi:filamentous hemagglutinin family protein
MKTSLPTLPVRKATILALIAGSSLGLAPAALAGPQGERVMRGQATFQRDPGITTITAANNTIINYRSFNIGSGEAVRFVQPSANSRVLNRITSASPTRIDGSLTANGQVYLVNPAGVFFGRNAVVDASAFYASAGKISDRDFLSGVNHFTNVTGPVVNQGMISAEGVTLIGRSIQNQGTIVADGGMVTTIVGNDVMIREGNGQIYVKIDGKTLNTAAGPAGGPATLPRGRTGIENSGTISANGGLVTLAAGDALSLAVHNSGTIDAAGGRVTVSSRSGQIVNDGTITASVDSGQAGSVIVQAPRLVNNGTVSADTNSGVAGSVEFTSSRSTQLNSGSMISAAGGSGVADGGHVLIHSYNGTTTLAKGATVDISGGEEGGNGGSGELSGKRLSVDGWIEGNYAPGAKPATMLLDPTDLVLGSSGTNDGDMNGGVINSGDGSGTFFVSTGAVENFAGDVRLEATNNITVNQSLNKTNGGLTLQAGHDIVFTAGSALGGATQPTLSIKANFLDFEAGHSILDQVSTGTQLTSSVGGITTVGTAGDVQFGLATVPNNQTLSITQAISKEVGAGPFGFVGNAANTNLVVRITDGFLVFGGEFGGVSGHQSIKSVDAQASDYVRVEDNLDIGTTANLRANNDVQIAGYIHAGTSVDLHAGMDGSGQVNFDAANLDIWGATIALRSGNHTGLGTATVDAVTNAPTFRGVGGGLTSPTSFTIQQDAAVTQAQLPAASQFGAGLNGMAYVLQSQDASVTEDNGSVFGGARLSLLSATGTFINGVIDPTSIDVTGPVQLSANVVSSSTQHYRGAMRLVGDRTLSGLSVTIDSTVDSGTLDGSNTDDASLSVRGFFLDNGAIGTLARLSSLTTSSITNLGGGTVITAGNQTYGGSVNLAHDAVLTSQADGVISFGGTVNGAHSLTVQTTEGGLISFGGDVGGVLRLLDINLSTAGSDGQRVVPTAATIVAPQNVTIKSRDFIMGQNEKFTTLGNLVINATRNVSLGDLTTSGDMTVTANAITLLLRAASPLLDKTNATIEDRGLDFVAGGNIAFNGAIILGGTAGAPHPTFADVDGLPNQGTLGGFEFKTSVPADTTADALVLNGKVLDLRTTPPPPPPPPPPPEPQNDRHVLAGVTDPIYFHDYVQTKVYDAAMMTRMGVAARNPSSEEARGALDGRAMYSDMPASLDRYSDRQFVATRADIASVKRVTKRYDATLGGEGQAQAMAKALGDAAERWYSLNQASAMDGAKFRAYLESNPAEKETLAAMVKLEAILTDVKALGLPPVEYHQTRERLLAAVASPKLPADQLAKAVDKQGS